MVMMIFLVDSNHVCIIQRFQSNLNKNDKSIINGFRLQNDAWLSQLYDIQDM